MKKATIGFLLLLMFIPAIVFADPIEYADGAYNTPPGWTEIGIQPVTSLDHYQYYWWVLNDLAYVPTAVNIVFHQIRNWAVEQNQLAVYFADASGGASWYGPMQDNQQTNSPDWSLWSNLGSWSDPVGAPNGPFYDVVFSVPLLADRSKMQSPSQQFAIGIDPDCHYDLTQITIDVAAPVPIPPALWLLGSGLLGMLGVKRRLEGKK